jgi:hypothetical protein
MTTPAHNAEWHIRNCLNYVENLDQDQVLFTWNAMMNMLTLAIEAIEETRQENYDAR